MFEIVAHRHAAPLSPPRVVPRGETLGRAVGALFPANRQPSLSWRAALCWLLIGTVAGLARQPLSLDAIWAEDGSIFLEQALRSSFADTLLAPYAGYLNVVPRLLTEIATRVPVEYAAMAFAVLGALVTAALALLVYVATGEHYRSQAIRATLASAFVLLPVARIEVLNNVTNIHWLLMAAAFWVLLWRPRTGAAVGVGTAAVALAGFSDPFALLLAPVALARVVAFRGWRDHLVTSGWAVGVGAQLLAVLLSSAPRELTPLLDPFRLGTWYLLHVVGGAAFGDELHRGLWPRMVVLAAAAVLMGIGIAILWLRGRAGRRHALPLLMLTTSVLCYVVPVGLTGLTPPRYAMMPVMLLIGVAAWVLDDPRLQRQRRAAAGLLVLVWGLGFDVAGPRTEGPRWSTALTRARAACPTARAITVPITPDHLGWEVTLPCAALDD